MKILWFTWKDMKNPLAGGAEVVNEELAKRLAHEGHEVLFVVGGFDGCESTEERDGFKIIRVGGRWTVYWHAYKYYKKNLVGWADLVIDEVNTIPFFAKFYVEEKNILFIHQLCRQIWFYQMFFPLNMIGYILEPIYLRLLINKNVITVSESTKADLVRNGFQKERIDIISEGIEIIPLEKLSPRQREGNYVILSLGAFREMKRTDEIVRAFEVAKEKNSELKLVMAGDTGGKFGEKVLSIIENSKYKDSIEVLGRVSEEKKTELMQKAYLIAVTSVKEGWGLIVTEANSQGTPAVVYDVDGLRDSVRHNETGLVCSENTPACLADNINKLLKNKDEYERLRKNAWEWSKQITFEKSYEDFKSIINNLK